MIFFFYILMILELKTNEMVYFNEFGKYQDKNI
jgi:hypothetical protein